MAEQREPEEITSGYCAGCFTFYVRLYRVSESRYRCVECAREEAAGLL